MLTRRIIPCLDVRDGKVVKGVRFQSLREIADPAERAFLYQQQGADEITMLDISATPQGRATAIETVARLRNCLSIPLTVGGGVRTIDDVARLLDAGADKVAINTQATREPALIEQCSRRFGAQCVVIAIDAKRQDEHWGVVVRSGQSLTPLDACDWARQVQQLGAGEILLTSWDRDGTRSGYDLELIAAVSSAVTIPVIASGGAAGPDHLIDALRAGADAVLAASIFHDGQFTVADIKRDLAQSNVEVRL